MDWQMSCPTPPPSVLPDISPSRGEISRSAALRSHAMAKINSLTTSEPGGAQQDGVISPLEGEMAGRPEGGASRLPSLEVRFS
jgi:hypothetical protein